MIEPDTPKSVTAEVSGVEAVSAVDTLTADTRYSFTGQFLVGAAIFTRLAHEIEADSTALAESTKSEHRAYVVGAILQSAAAIDAEASEITIHGPGHHLGSNGTDSAARDFLLPLRKLIDDEPAVSRYNIILHLLHKPRLDSVEEAKLLMQTRNELMHYKSRWGEEMSNPNPKTLFNKLERLKLEKPPFMPVETNFFPHRCLSASFASWAVQTSVKFLDDFYQHLSIKSVLEAHTAALTVPPPRRSIP